jgi:nucleoside phosphorylase
MTIAFVCAMPMEVVPLVEKLELRESERNGIPMYCGELAGADVVAIVTGMGTEFARDGLEQLLDAVAVERVVVVGITGALEHETPIGTLIRPALVVDGATGREHQPLPFGAGTPHGKM